MKNLAAALLSAQKALPQIHKDSRATVPTKSGGSFTYTYLSLPQLLDTVVPVLNANDLALTQMPSFHDGRETLETRLIHGPSGEMLEGHSPLVLNGDATPQTWGGAITYARRYALTALLGIAADEDDDAQQASSGREAARSSSTPGAAAQPFEPHSQPNEDPDRVWVTFGTKHKGERLIDVLASDPGYVKWMVSDKFEPKTEDQRRLVAAARAMLEPSVPDDDIPFLWEDRYSAEPTQAVRFHNGG